MLLIQFDDDEIFIHFNLSIFKFVKSINYMTYFCRMKIFSFLLSIYLFCLAIMPCSDIYLVLNEVEHSAAYHSDHESHDHNQNKEQHCSPFCTCTCCHTLINFEFGNKDISKKDWRRINIRFLEGHKYFTPYGKEKLQPVKNQHLDELIIYPNPILENLYLQIFTYSNEAVKIQMIDLLGKVVAKSEFNTFMVGYNIIDFPLPSDLSQGIYLINIKSESFEYTRRVIKN